MQKEKGCEGFFYVIMLPLLITWETERKELFHKEGGSSQERFEFDLFSKIHLPTFPGRLQSFNMNGLCLIPYCCFILISQSVSHG